jgi:O-antigen ligase
VAGLTVTWRECTQLAYVFAAGAGICIMIARVFSDDSAGRLSLESGTIANSNDLAAFLLLALPFLLWVFFTRRFMPLRLAAFGLFGIGIYEILHTASRGALLGLAAGSLFYLFRATWRQKLAFACLFPIGAGLLISVLPRETLTRMVSFSDESPDDEAAASTRTRIHLTGKSIEYALHNPILGIGPGQFTIYVGTNDIIPGFTHGIWQNAHNTYTQVACENGMPAFFFYLAAIIVAFRKLNGVYKEARRRPECSDIQSMAFCVMLGLISFSVAIAFVNFAYFFYWPVMTGLAVVMARAAPEEFRAREAAVNGAAMAAVSR